MIPIHVRSLAQVVAMFGAGLTQVALTALPTTRRSRS